MLGWHRVSAFGISAAGWCLRPRRKGVEETRGPKRYARRRLWLRHYFSPPLLCAFSYCACVRELLPAKVATVVWGWGRVIPEGISLGGRRGERAGEGKVFLLNPQSALFPLFSPCYEPATVRRVKNAVVNCLSNPSFAQLFGEGGKNKESDGKMG